MEEDGAGTSSSDGVLVAGVADAEATFGRSSDTEDSAGTALGVGIEFVAAPDFMRTTEYTPAPPTNTPKAARMATVALGLGEPAADPWWIDP